MIPVSFFFFGWLVGWFVHKVGERYDSVCSYRRGSVLVREIVGLLLYRSCCWHHQLVVTVAAAGGGVDVVAVAVVYLLAVAGGGSVGKGG